MQAKAPQQSQDVLQLPPARLQHTVTDGAKQRTVVQVVLPCPVSQHWLALVQGCCRPEQGGGVVVVVVVVVVVGAGVVVVVVGGAVVVVVVVVVGATHCPLLQVWPVVQQGWVL